MTSQPTNEDLVRYAIGELNPERTAAVERHLDGAADARELVARVRGALEVMSAGTADLPSEGAVRRVLDAFAPATAPVLEPVLGHWIDRAARLVAQLVFDSRRQPMLAGFRGGGNTAQLAYESDAARIDLRLSPPAAGAEEWRLQGQVTAHHDEEAPGRVALVPREGSGETAETTMDERGRFSLPFRAGPCDLLFELHGSVLVVPELDVG